MVEVCNEPEATCPYCNKILEQIPQRKKQCSFCKKYIYVRNRKLVTEDDAKKFDWLKRLGEYGVVEQDFEVTKAQLSEKFKEEPSDQDIFWSLFHQLIKKNRNDLQTLKMIYYEMALFLNESGKDYFTALQLSHKMDLMYYKKRGIINKVKIITCGTGSCEQCQLLQDKIYSIEEALEKMPVPNKNCTKIMFDKNRGFCKCCYVASF